MKRINAIAMAMIVFAGCGGGGGGSPFFGGIWRATIVTTENSCKETITPTDVELTVNQDV